MTRLLPRWLDPAAGLGSIMYTAIMNRRNARYDARGPRGRLPVPVVSVGNLCVGGVGKTPCVRWLAEALIAKGRRPLIAMRGYGAKHPEASDEAREYAADLPDVPRVVHPDRFAAVSAFFEREGTESVDVVLLDDGFQHRQLHRDLDIVLIDANDPPDRDHVLPRGRLREAAVGLRRAGAIVMTHADGVDDQLARRMDELSGGAPIAWSQHAWVSVQVHEGGTPRIEETSWLAGRRVVAALGVGSPERVLHELDRHGAEIGASLPMRDHQVYDAKLASWLAEQALAHAAAAVVVTAKDWVKLADVIDWKAWTVPVVVPDLHLHVFAGADALMANVLAVVPAPGTTAT